MNWGELKQEIRDLGFEEDGTMEEYESIVINAANRAARMIIHECINANKEYFGALYATKKKTTDPTTGEVKIEVRKWTQPEWEDITADTADETDIDLPDRVIHILPILASHYVWLDDDQVKATTYWNEFDDFENTLNDEARNRNYNCEFYGGLWF